MIDPDQFKTIVLRALALKSEQYHETLALGEVPQWDSLAHLSLLFAIEDGFGVHFDSGKIPRLDTLPKIRDEITRLRAPSRT